MVKPIRRNTKLSQAFELLKKPITIEELSTTLYEHWEDPYGSLECASRYIQIIKKRGYTIEKVKVSGSKRHTYQVMDEIVYAHSRERTFRPGSRLSRLLVALETPKTSDEICRIIFDEGDNCYGYPSKVHCWISRLEESGVKVNRLNHQKGRSGLGKTQYVLAEECRS